MWCDWISCVGGRSVWCGVVATGLFFFFVNFIFCFPVSGSAWHCGCGSGGSVWFQVTHSCVGGLVAGSNGFCLLIGNALPSPLPTPWLPINATNVSLWLIMRYACRAVYLQGSETPLCINRPAIHNIGSDIFTNLSADGGVDICFLSHGNFGKSSQQINSTLWFCF